MGAQQKIKLIKKGSTRQVRLTPEANRVSAKPHNGLGKRIPDKEANRPEGGCRILSRVSRRHGFPRFIRLRFHA
jgi:hypothetical protein